MGKLRVKIHGFAVDAMGAIKAAKARFEKILHSSEKDIEEDPVTSLAKKLHQSVIPATITSVEKDGEHASRIRFHADNPLYFVPGQYLTVTLRIGESILTRPYSIASSPSEGQKGDVVIIVKEKKGGIMSPYLVHQAKVEDKVFLEVGLGEFTYNPFRDQKEIVAIAGGVGITPFLSMSHTLIEAENPPYHLTILYGSRKADDILAKGELDGLNGERVRVIHVLSDEPEYDGEKGFIDEELLRKYAPEKASYFLCGPKAMQDYVLGELSKLGYDIRKARCECPASAMELSNNPEIFDLKVLQGEQVFILKCRSDETLATALERNGIYIRTRCHHGHCGACRAEVISGKFEVPFEDDGRRFCDKEFGYVYLCHCYPRGNMTIRINPCYLPE